MNCNSGHVKHYTKTRLAACLMQLKNIVCQGPDHTAEVNEAETQVADAVQMYISQILDIIQRHFKY